MPVGAQVWCVRGGARRARAVQASACMSLAALSRSLAPWGPLHGAHVPQPCALTPALTRVGTEEASCGLEACRKSLEVMAIPAEVELVRCALWPLGVRSGWRRSVKDVSHAAMGVARLMEPLRGIVMPRDWSCDRLRRWKRKVPDFWKRAPAGTQARMGAQTFWDSSCRSRRECQGQREQHEVSTRASSWIGEHRGEHGEQQDRWVRPIRAARGPERLCG